ncbi:MAG: hypothetical protein SGPRY_013141, partial [Prymnesium sp.]
LSIPKRLDCDYSDFKAKGNELWLIRCPPGFDASQLEGLEIDEAALTSGATSLGTEGLSLCPTPLIECAHHMVALPSSHANRWRVGKVPSRHFALLHSHDAKWATPCSPSALPAPPKHVGLHNRHPSLLAEAERPACEPLRLLASEGSMRPHGKKRKKEQAEHAVATATSVTEPSVPSAGVQVVVGKELKEKKKSKKEKKAAEQVGADAGSDGGKAVKEQTKPRKKKADQEDAGVASAGATLVPFDGVEGAGVEGEQAAKVDKKIKKEKAEPAISRPSPEGAPSVPFRGGDGISGGGKAVKEEKKSKKEKKAEKSEVGKSSARAGKRQKKEKQEEV